MHMIKASQSQSDELQRPTKQVMLACIITFWPNVELNAHFTSARGYSSSAFVRLSNCASDVVNNSATSPMACYTRLGRAKNEGKRRAEREEKKSGEKFRKSQRWPKKAMKCLEYAPKPNLNSSLDST